MTPVRNRVVYVKGKETSRETFARLNTTIKILEHYVVYTSEKSAQRS